MGRQTRQDGLVIADREPMVLWCDNSIVVTRLREKKAKQDYFRRYV